MRNAKTSRGPQVLQNTQRCPPRHIFGCIGVPGYSSYVVQDVGRSTARKPHQTTCYLAKLLVTLRLILLELFKLQTNHSRNHPVRDNTELLHDLVGESLL